MTRAAVALALSLALAGAAGAEPPAPSSATAGRLRADLVKLRAEQAAARRQRNWGWGLAAAGTALACSGIVAIVVAELSGVFQLADDPRAYEHNQIVEFVGGGMLAVGVGVGIWGLVWSLRGQLALTDLEWRLRGGVAFVAPTTSGFMAGARIRF